MEEAGKKFQGQKLSKDPVMAGIEMDLMGIAALSRRKGK